MPPELDLLSESLLDANQKDNASTINNIEAATGALQAVEQEDQHQHQLEHDSSQMTQSPTTSKSKNINRLLLFTFFAFASRSTWNQSVLSAYVYLLKSDDPKFVGILTCIMGLSQFIVSFPAGIIADKYRRDIVLKASFGIGLLALVVTVVATHLQSFVLLGVGLSIWGIYGGFCYTSAIALFADSIDDGERSKYFTQRTIVQYLGNSAGPFVALIMFSSIGNDWTIKQCQVVLVAGQLLSIPSFVMLCFVSDDDIVSSSSTTTSSSSLEVETNENENDDNDDLSMSSNDLETPLLSAGASSTRTSNDESFIDHPHNTAISIKTSDQQKRRCLIIPESRYIPVMVAISDTINGLASGMSIRYFPIFFLDNLKLSPGIAQVLFLSSTLGMAAGSQVTQKLAAAFGRLPVTIIVRIFGMSLMVTMVASYQLQAPIWLVCTIWVLRTSIMNTTGALSTSLLMDNVIPSERAKWSALESLNFFGWSGSAAFGGYLVDWAGIELNFYVTACVSFLATLPLMTLLGKVGKEERTQG